MQVRCFAIVLAMLVLGCGGKKDSSPRGLCERACSKLMGCIPGAGAEDTSACTDQCAMGAPQQVAQVEELEAMSCDQVGQYLQQMMGGGGGGAGGGAAGGGRPGCAADCRNCVGDNSSCYNAAGGAHGIPCDPCCCAAGGPSPTWRTDD